MAKADPKTTVSGYTPIYPEQWDYENISRLITRWNMEVLNLAEHVDPNNESRWSDLAMGFGLGAGLTPDQAVDFELYLTSLRLI